MEGGCFVAPFDHFNKRNCMMTAPTPLSPPITMTVVCKDCAHIRTDRGYLSQTLMDMLVYPDPKATCVAYHSETPVKKNPAIKPAMQRITLREQDLEKPITVSVKAGPVRCTVGNFDGHCPKFVARNTAMPKQQNG